MKRFKPLLIAGAVAAAIFSLVKGRLAENQPVDPGGWKPVDPS